jgi:hypothetical protein
MKNTMMQIPVRALYTVVAIAALLMFAAGCKKDSGNPPTVTTGVVTNISATGARVGGMVTDDGGLAVTERGVCWSTTGEPGIGDYKANDGSAGTGSFSANLSGLTGNTVYYVRAYALNGAGVGYGDVRTFTTAATSADAVTVAATGVKSEQAVLHGWVNANNQATTVSFEYGPTTAYGQTISAAPATVSGTGDSVSAALSGLTPVTTYHYRIKIVNVYGTAYGSDMTFYTGYTIGEHTQGGIVFYTDNTGTHGMVYTDSSIANTVPWYNGSYVVTNATGIAMGTGSQNTAAIVSAQGNGNYAAALCSNLTYGGYSDWYLPSPDEFNQILLSNPTYQIGLWGYYYWSSAEVDANTAYLIHVTNLGYYSKQVYDKSTTAGPGQIVGTTIPVEVRAVRQF